MRAFKSVLVVLFVLACVGGGFLLYSWYENSRPPSFSAERFARLCRPQILAEVKALKAQQQAALAQAQVVYLYTDAVSPEAKAEKKQNIDDAQAALDELNANGVYSKATYFMRHADEIGRRTAIGDLIHESLQLGQISGAEMQPLDAAQERVQLCMLEAKLAELEQKPVGDEAFNLPPQAVTVPLKKNEKRIAFQNGCGAVVYSSSSSDSALNDTVWLGACNFGLAHGKGFRQWSGTMTPVTYFYGYDVTPGRDGSDGATGDPAEIAARFKPLEEARLKKLQAMYAARAAGKGR